MTTLPNLKYTKNNKVRMILICPSSSVFGTPNPCSEIEAVPWYMTCCGGENWISVDGMVHCDCSVTKFFDLWFICGQDRTRKERFNLSNLLLAISMA